MFRMFGPSDYDHNKVRFFTTEIERDEDGHLTICKYCYGLKYRLFDLILDVELYNFIDKSDIRAITEFLVTLYRKVNQEIDINERLKMAIDFYKTIDFLKLPNNAYYYDEIRKLADNYICHKFKIKKPSIFFNLNVY